MAHSRPVTTSGSGCANGLTPGDFAVSATAHDLPSLDAILKLIKNSEPSKMIDLGCGYGGLTTYVARYLNVDNVYGIDIDRERLDKAQSKGINTYEIDLNKDALPFANGYFDLVVSFGALEHLMYFDNFFSESLRILSFGGHIVLAMPNLASYINRIALLLGYQPRDVEVSQEFFQGTLPFYPSGFLGHVHSATLRTIKQMMEYYGFHVIKVKPSSPYQANKLVKVMDKIFSHSPGLSRRFIILGRKR